jgi:hypothetical protein
MKAKRSLKDTKTAALKNLTARKRSKRMEADVRGGRALDVVPAPKVTKYYDTPSPY